jgi:prophage maintenance system killer protein
MNHLRKRHVLLLHAQLIAETGGSEGVRDEGLLDAALDAPQRASPVRSSSQAWKRKPPAWPSV